MNDLNARVWDIKKKRMIYFNAYEEWGIIDYKKSDTVILQGSDRLMISNDPNQFIWMLWSGQTDKNNRQIFVGDIKRETEESDEGDTIEYYICVFIKEWSSFSWLHYPGEYDAYNDIGINALEEDMSMSNTFGIFDFEMKSTEVCGNIYEHPNKLEDKILPEEFLEGKSMSKEKAYNAMLAGKKVRHEYYSDHEYIFINKEGNIQSEEGVNHGGPDDEFWRVRQEWNWGWSIVS